MVRFIFSDIKAHEDICFIYCCYIDALEINAKKSSLAANYVN